MANTVAYDYTIFDRYSGPLNKIRRATEKFRQQAKKAALATGEMGKKFKAAGDKMSSMQNAIAGAGAGIAIKSLVENSIKMEDAIADVGKVSDFTRSELGNLRVQLEKMSERLGRPAEGLARIAFEGKKLGTTNDDLLPFVETVAKMAVAFDTTEEAAGAAIGSIKAKLGLSMKDIVRFADSANHLANTMATSGGNIIQITQRIAGTMKTLKVPPGIVAGFAAFADQAEVTPELAASGLNMMLNRMMVMPGMMEKLLQDPVKAVQDQMSKLAQMPEAKRAKKIFKMFGQESGRFVLKLTSNLELFEKTMQTAMSTKAVGSMDAEMKNMLARTSTRLKTAQIKISNALRLLGDALAPIIIMIANGISKFAKFAVKMSIAYPVLTKIATGMLLLGAAIPILMVPLGFLISGMGTLMTLLGGISLPIVAVVAGVASLAASFAYWWKTGHPVVKTLKNIWSMTKELISPFAVLFKKFEMGGKLLKFIGFSFKFTGYLINLMLKPVEILLVALTSLVDIFKKLKDLDFKKAFKSYIGAYEKAAKILGFGGKDSEVQSKQVVESSAKVKQESNVNVGGTIKVAAEKGSKVVTATPDLNTGTNMEYAY